MKAVGDRLVVEQKPVEESKYDKFIPEQFKEKPQTGIVISAGEDIANIKDGDTVVFGKYSGTEFELSGKKYLILRQDEILVVL